MEPTSRAKDSKKPKLRENGRNPESFAPGHDAQQEQLLLALQAARAGDFGARLPTRGGDGRMNEIAEEFNALVSLSKKITVDAESEVRELKNTINTMVDQLEIKRQAALLAESVARYEDERRARATAEAARCAREEALGVVSHDLRTPLSTISMIAEGILANPPTTEDDCARHVKGAATIVRATDQMARLLDDLLDVARIEAGRLSFERTPHTTDELIVQVMDMLQPLAVQAGMQLTVVNEVEGVRVQCDPDRVFQVFSNLVGNAIKFDRPNGTVAIHARAAGALVEFSMSDDGPGIPPEQLPHLFERRGLAIVKGIVEAHGGTIAVQSSREAGTTFTFTIPTAPG